MIYAFGHNNLLCTHSSTIELTKEKNLSIRGNCILGVNASKACLNLNSELKENIIKEKRFKITLKVDNLTDFFYGFGNKELTLRNEVDMVFRRSNFTCDRTVLINCTKSARELDRNLVGKLRTSRKKILIMVIIFLLKITPKIPLNAEKILLKLDIFFESGPIFPVNHVDILMISPSPNIISDAYKLMENNIREPLN